MPSGQGKRRDGTRILVRIDIICPRHKCLASLLRRLLGGGLLVVEDFSISSRPGDICLVWNVLGVVVQSACSVEEVEPLVPLITPASIPLLAVRRFAQAGDLTGRNIRHVDEGE